MWSSIFTSFAFGESDVEGIGFFGCFVFFVDAIGHAMIGYAVGDRFCVSIWILGGHFYFYNVAIDFVGELHFEVGHGTSWAISGSKSRW